MSQLFADTDIDRAIAELKAAAEDLFAPYNIERAIAGHIRQKFSIESRIDRATRQHRARRHLLRHQRLAKTKELAA